MELHLLSIRILQNLSSFFVIGPTFLSEAVASVSA